MPAEATLPKVTPYLVERADSMCARRLRRMFQDLRGDEGAFTRGRIRDPLVEDARAAHAELGPPNPESFSVRPGLLPEEQELYRRAADHYLDLFAGEAVRSIDHDDYERPVTSPRRGVRIGGWIDLACEGPDGERELRQFELWGRDRGADPRHHHALLLAALRLSRWVDDRPLRIRQADLVAGRVEEHTVEPGDFADLRALFERRLARLRLRAGDAKAPAEPGEDCAGCGYVNGCPAFR